MRSVVQFMHVSLDGFISGPNGEMNWIIAGEDMFVYAGNQTDRSDTALYGRITFDMMDSYWPTAADEPGASEHDRTHSAWYNQVEKVVLSRTMKTAERPGTTIVSENFPDFVRALKSRPGKDIVLFGSPSVCQLLMEENLIDDYWLFVNPLILGQGKPLFRGLGNRISLHLKEQKILQSGVVMLHYQKKPA